MRASPAQESQLIERILTFQDLPLDYARFIYPWGEKGTALERIKGLAPWQVEELGALQDHLCTLRRFRDDGLEPPEQVFRAAWSSGRGLYKSALLAIINQWHVSTHLGGQGIVAANSENQLRARIFPEFALWFGAALNSHWWNVEGMKITPQAWLTEPMRKLPEEGGLGLDPQFWGVYGQMWSEESPSSFAGGRSKYGTMVTFDEASGIPLPVWIVTDGFFAPAMDYKLWFVASQMRSNKGPFRDVFYDTQFGRGWHTRTMSAESMPDQAAWAREMIERWGAESDHVRVEVRGLPPQTSEDQFVPEGNVRAARGNVLVPDYGEALIGGVDPAPRGRTAIRFRQGRNARDCAGPFTKIVLEGYDNMQIAERIIDLDHRLRPSTWCIDFGMGTGVIDILKRRRLNGRVVEVKFGDMPPKHDGAEFGSMGAYLWGKMRDWLPGGMIENDDPDDVKSLSAQLLNRGWKWSGREDGRKVLEAKMDMKARGVASPDDADALAVTFAVNPPRTDRAPRGGAARRVDGAEDNPYGF